MVQYQPLTRCCHQSRASRSSGRFPWSRKHPPLSSRAPVEMERSQRGDRVLEFSAAARSTCGILGTLLHKSTTLSQDQYVLYDVQHFNNKADSYGMSKDICGRFGERIKQVRTQKKITQVALCHKISMEQKTLSAVENGRMEPCLRNIELLAIGLGVPLARLFKDL